MRWVRAQAFTHEGGLSYGLARRLVRALCAIGVDDPDPEATRHLGGQLDALGIAGTFPILAHFLGLPLGPSDARRLANLPPQELRRLTFDAVAELVCRLAAEGPLVLELDDLHWADPSSVDLLLELLACVDRGPVFLCCAFRPERDAPSWALRERAASGLPDRYVEVTLRPLSETSSAELVAKLLRVDELPPGLRGTLERAAGTPLWVEELVRTLIERGLLVAEDGRWRVTADLDRVEIPTSLQALIVARIDRLGEARPTLQTASVIGRRFGWRVLERVAADEPRLGEHLRLAERADLVRELAGIPEREYGFKHVLTQEAAYATLLLRRRRELHRQVAGALEALYPERVDELHAILAHHYFQAEAWAEAHHHARLAAEAARADYANREALAEYGQALAAAERAELGPAERLELHAARGQVHEVLGGFEPARADYEAALALAEAAGDGSARARLLGALGMLWGGHKDYQRGLDLTRRSAALAEAAGDTRGLAEARVRLGVMLLNLARLGESRRELEAALALFLELGDERGRAQTLDVLAMVTFCAGDLARSVEYAEDAARRLRALGDRWTEASSTVILGLGLGYLGERAASEEWIRRALAIWTEIGARSGEAFARWCIAESIETFGAYDLAFREGTRGLQMARELGHREWMAGGLSHTGRVRRACGDVAGARGLHEEMLATARELGTTLWIAEALGNLAADVMLEGDEATASRYLVEAVATGGEALKFTLRALFAQAELPLRFGRPAEALAAAHRFLETAPQFGVFAADARRVEGEALAALGRADEAEASLRRAKAEAVALGAEPPRWRACLALGRLLELTGRPAEAAAEYREALTSLEAVADTLSDPDLRRSFEQSEPMRRARAAAAHPS
jgi:tetratricopeptide (TPR) repeat protein